MSITIIKQINKYTNVDTSYFTSILANDNEKQLFGKISNYDKQKGFGFITSPIIRGRDLFFHKNAVLNLTNNDELVKDKFISFELGEGKTGECAINVVLIADEQECYAQ